MPTARSFLRNPPRQRRVSSNSLRRSRAAPFAKALALPQKGILFLQSSSCNRNRRAFERNLPGDSTRSRSAARDLPVCAGTNSNSLSSDSSSPSRRLQSKRPIANMASLSQERKNDAFSLPALAICSSSPSSSCSSSSSSKYIEHNVSKLDTLAGVAIKYGVEVADIKRINGLSTDLQMFAHKSLLIPLRGRHPPPSPIQSKALVDDRDVLDSFQSAKLKSDGSFITSSAMSTLQRYYGLTQHENISTPEGTEMTVYRACGSPNLENVSQHRSHLADNDLEQALLLDKSGDANDDGGEKSTIDKPVRRRQKTDNDPLISPEAAIEDDDKGFVTRIRRSLAPRSLLASLIDPEPVKQNTTPTEETSLTNSLLAVRKSSSNSSLQDSENNDSIWTYSKWTLKPDSVTRPIFSALPKQISVWRSKAALD